MLASTKITKSLALGDRQRFGNVVDAADPDSAKRDRSSPKGRARLRSRSHVAQAAPQRLVDQVLLARIALPAHTFERNRHIMIDCQGGSHASLHRRIDVLLPTMRSQLRRSRQADLLPAGALGPDARSVPPRKLI